MSEVPAAPSAPPPPPQPDRVATPTAPNVSYPAAPPIGPAYFAAPVAAPMGAPVEAAGTAAPLAAASATVAPGAGATPAQAPPPYQGPAAAAGTSATSTNAAATLAPHPVSASADASAISPHVAPSPRKRLRWLWWTAGSLVFASLAGLSAYLVVVTQQWSDRVDDLTAISEDLGTQVAEQNVARKEAEDEAKSLQSQVDTATARITELANEEANANDREEMWISLLDNMVSCADERQLVIYAYINNRTFEGISRQDYAAELVAYCDTVKADFEGLKAEAGE